MKVGLALGGGAVRGLAHIGVLKVLKKHQIPIHFIAGTSMGGAIGGLVATGIDIEEIEFSLLHRTVSSISGFENVESWQAIKYTRGYFNFWSKRD